MTRKPTPPSSGDEPDGPDPLPPIDVPFRSVAIERLIAEVRDDFPGSSTGYNRTYSRHNR